MEHIPKVFGWLALAIRWIARIISALMALFVFLIAIGEGLVPADLTLEEVLMMLGFFTAWLGFLLGWKWEGLGGGLIIAGLAWHCLLEYVFRGSLFLGFWVTLPALPGVLFLFYRWISRRDRHLPPSPLTSSPASGTRQIR